MPCCLLLKLKLSCDRKIMSNFFRYLRYRFAKHLGGVKRSLKNINMKYLNLFLLLLSLGVLEQSKLSAQVKSKKMQKLTPCMKFLPLFTAANVPKMAPEEQYAPLISSDEPTPSNLPGNGLAQHPMLYVYENCNRMSLVNNGKVIWTYSTRKGPEYDDVWMLSNVHLEGAEPAALKYIKNMHFSF